MNEIKITFKLTEEEKDEYIKRLIEECEKLESIREINELLNKELETLKYEKEYEKINKENNRLLWLLVNKEYPAGL